MRFRYRAYPFDPRIPDIGQENRKPIENREPSLPASASPITISLLPRYPFDYPFLEALDEIIGSAPDSVTAMLKEGGWPRADFIFPSITPLARRLKAMNDERVFVRFARPSYPALPVRATDGGAGDSLDWFDFYRVLLRICGRRATGIPVVFTDLAGDARAAFFAEPGTPIASILARFRKDTPDQDIVVFDHPFTGTCLSPSDTIDDFKAHSVIVATRNLRSRPKAGSVLRRMVFRNENYSFSGLYNSMPREVGRPCQKCLHCVHICPVDIWPFMIAALAANEDVKNASAYRPDRCIECGLCSYVCPSGIPLMHTIQALKKELGVAK